jgi:phenylalanyl-tRNA synthetase beta chain
VVDGVIDVIAADSAPTKLTLEPDRINKLLGTDISKDFMIKVLRDLGFTFDGDMMTVPSWRGDVTHYSDVAEEVARFYGYDVIESTTFKGAAAEGCLTAKQQAERNIGALCRSMGFNEILTYSLIGYTDYDKVNMPLDHKLRTCAVIQNPLGEDSSVMRTTMLPSLLECLGGNNSYRNKDVKLYELGQVYLPRDEEALPEEIKILSLGLYGKDADFYTLIGYVDALLSSLRIKDAVYEACPEEYAYHPGRCAKIYKNGRYIGILGEIHPKVSKNYGITSAVCAAGLVFDALYEIRDNEAVYTPLPRFPAVLRDLAVVCGEEITVRALEERIKSAAGVCTEPCGGRSLLSEINFFDVYKGQPIPAGKKSVAFSLCFRSDEKSLTDDDIAPVMSKILQALDEQLGAKIR